MRLNWLLSTLTLSLSLSLSLRTPLMLAVMGGHTDVTQLLVDRAAQVDCTDKHLHTALHRAVSPRHTLQYILMYSSIFFSISSCILVLSSVYPRVF